MVYPIVYTVGQNHRSPRYGSIFVKTNDVKFHHRSLKSIPQMLGILPLKMVVGMGLSIQWESSDWIIIPTLGENVD
jgi:hypothetical protein